MWKVLVIVSATSPYNRSQVLMFEFNTKSAALEAKSFFEKAGIYRAIWLKDNEGPCE